MQEKSEFRLVNKTDLLRNFIKKTDTIFPWTQSERDKVFGIAKGNELVSACAYLQLLDGNIQISFVWSTKKSPLVKEFLKEFEVTPAILLKEMLIRQGTRVFRYSKLQKSGARLLKRLEEKKLVSKYSNKPVFLSNEVRVNDNWINLANSRKRVLK